MFDRYFSYILQAVKDCYYNNLGMHLDNLVFHIDLALLAGLV